MPTEIINPTIFRECANCEFAQRMADRAVKSFPQATTITLGCYPSGGGGAKQVEPGKWIEFKSRRIEAHPNIVSEGRKTEYLEGSIPTCPADIEDSHQEYPHLPQPEMVYQDTFGRWDRYRLPK